MKKIIDIAFKDMTQSFRSLFAIMFMFVVPILMTGMFYLMFGGSSDEDEMSFVQSTKIILVNKDAGKFGESAVIDFASSIGEMMVLVLTSDDLTSLIEVSFMDDPHLARESVDQQKAGAAVIIPEDTTDQYMDPQGHGFIEFYQDPTLIIGPEIIKGIVSQTLDDFSSSKIALSVSMDQLEKTMGSIDNELIEELIGEYVQILQNNSLSKGSENSRVRLDIRNPDLEDKTEEQNISAVSMIMAGMTIFYIFFTGASGAQTLLKEETTGTLPRLLTTPTSETKILAGKFLAVALTILVQITVLLLVGYLVFQIQWGGIFQLLVMSAGITLAASSFGIFLVSWVRTERQAGAMIGGVVTIMGMMGMIPLFVMGMPNPPGFIKTASLFVPQGWAVAGLQKTMLGGSLLDILPNMLILILWAAVFLLIGIFRFSKRFN